MCLKECLGRHIDVLLIFHSFGVHTLLESVIIKPEIRHMIRFMSGFVQGTMRKNIVVCSGCSQGTSLDDNLVCN